MADVAHGWDVLEVRLIPATAENGVLVEDAYKVVWKKPCDPLEEADTCIPQPSGECLDLGCKALKMKTWVQFALQIDLDDKEFYDPIFADTAPFRYVAFEIRFDAVDANNNTGEGIFIDDFKILTLCL